MSKWVRFATAGVVIAAVIATILGLTRPPERQSWPEPRSVTNPLGRLDPSNPVQRKFLAADEAWVASGRDPGRGTPWADMSHWALMDLRRLTSGPGGPTAGAGENWGFFWPRDGAFVAVALAQTGHPDDARRVLDFTADLPFDEDRGFDARYLLSGGKVEHSKRGPQSDGCGWVLWALGEIRADAPAALPSSAGQLREKCVANLMELTDKGKQLPPPSPDYWEVKVRDTSLGTVGPMLAGLRRAADDYTAAGQTDRAAACALAASRLSRQLAEEFGPNYERFGDKGGMDAAIALLMPPFAPAPSAAVKSRWSAYQVDALRVSGGLAPGTDWKQDGTLWTPETALIAYTAAAAEDQQTAEKWLTWLSENRAPWGSLPEKVTANGRPAGPAPLLWTVALVLLALHHLLENR